MPKRPTVRMIHGACHGHAFDYDDPEPGMPLIATRVSYTDGRRVAAGEPMLCQTCGENVWFEDYRLDLTAET